MKYKITTIILFLFSCELLYSQKVTSSLSRETIRYGEPVVLQIKVQAEGLDNVMFPIIKDTLTYHLELLSEKKDTLKKEKNYFYIDSITFSSYELGEHIIPPLKIVVNSKEYFTPAYKLTVDSMDIDSLKQPLYDIYPIITEPKTFSDYFQQYLIYIVIGIILLIVIIVAIIAYYLGNKKKKLRNNLGSNPDKIAIKKLLKLEKSGYLNKGMSKKYYSKMILILKEYMEARWDFPATKFLSDELLEYLKKNKQISQDREKELHIIFQSADLAKFAKSRPSVVETKGHTEMARNFINETKVEFLNYKEI